MYIQCVYLFNNILDIFELFGSFGKKIMEKIALKKLPTPHRNVKNNFIPQYSHILVNCPLVYLCTINGNVFICSVL